MKYEKVNKEQIKCIMKLRNVNALKTDAIFDERTKAQLLYKKSHQSIMKY